MPRTIVAVKPAPSKAGASGVTRYIAKMKLTANVGIKNPRVVHVQSDSDVALGRLGLFGVSHIILHPDQTKKERPH